MRGEDAAWCDHASSERDITALGERPCGEHRTRGQPLATRFAAGGEVVLAPMPCQLPCGMHFRMEDDRRQRGPPGTDTEELDLRELVEDVVGVASVLASEKSCELNLRHGTRGLTGRESAQRVSAVPAVPGPPWRPVDHTDAGVIPHDRGHVGGWPRDIAIHPRALAPQPLDDL